MLVNMVFGLQYLDFNRENELQHVELFAGDCSVTCGEAMDRGSKLKNAKQICVTCV